MSDVPTMVPRSEANKYKYGIVIDSGSSGSRIQIYKWEDPSLQKLLNDQNVLRSPPKITQEDNWTKKITPGISTYNTKSKITQIWLKHYSELMKFAESIIPADKHQDTPVFVLSTAGMRLLPKRTQKAILQETCNSIRQNTNFQISSCRLNVQTIDGSTEGIYGWLGLNYLMGQFNNYDPSSLLHETIGFMDMGGASTQIAFVPSSAEQIERHREDLSRVTLRTVEGQTVEWNLFVATWLGFGANEARKRYINQLINLASVNQNLHDRINDPCLPKGATFTHEFDGKKFTIEGVGNYEMCVRSIYPLLMKSIPCAEEPCLFNGIHGPKLDFQKDKFVGVSEYWYTANDIFQSGGEYDFKGFNSRVKEYCESPWGTILQNSKDGQYSGLDPEKFLKDACFKASWVMNVLHDGFELPRIGFELDQDGADDVGKDDSSKAIMNKHVPFKSADSVGGKELSWTLGRILLYASSQIEPLKNDDLEIGIYPSEISGTEFISGGHNSGYISEDDSDDEKDGPFGHFIYSSIFVFLMFFFIYHFGKHHFKRWGKGLNYLPIPRQVSNFVARVAQKIPGFDLFAVHSRAYNELEQSISLEEGYRVTDSPRQSTNYSPDLSVLRTRLAIGLNDEYENLVRDVPVPASASSSIGAGTGGGNNNLHFAPRVNNFLSKPFMIPKASSNFQISRENSAESLSKKASIARSKSSLE